MKFVRIEPGTFEMGAQPGEPLSEPGENLHEVTITKPFFYGVYEVTQSEYERVMKKNPSYYSESGEGRRFIEEVDSATLPVENVTWDDAVEFCKKLSELEKSGGFTYRLPSEAEWEYCCRAGTTTPTYFGQELTGNDANIRWTVTYPPGEDVKDIIFLNRPEKVGSYKPNDWGLYDTIGNVWEWTHDWYDDKYYSNSPKEDPMGPEGEVPGQKSVRGGSWGNVPSSCRAANRKGMFTTQTGTSYGFRVVLVPND